MGSYKNILALANIGIEIKDRITLKGIAIEGNLYSNGDILYGIEVVQKGNSYSLNNIILNDRATIDGNLQASGNITISPTASVSGTIADNTLVNIPSLPLLGSILYSNINVFIPPKGTLTLLPGNFGEFYASASTSVTFKNGIYAFKKFVLEPDVKMYFDMLPADTIKILSQETIHFADRCKMILNDTSDSSRIYIYSNQTDDFIIGVECAINGLLATPKSRLLIGSRTNIKGYIAANKIIIAPDVKLNAIGLEIPPFTLVADFTGSPLTGPAGHYVNFSDTTVGSPTSWDWDFGDGSLHSTAQNPTHIYKTAGVYNVSLTSSDGISFNTHTKLGYITVSLVTNFTGSPLTGPAGLSVNFTDTTIGNPTSWDWDFGDGSLHSIDQNPTHIYKTAGVYNVSLTSSKGSSFNTHTKLGYITVSLVTNFTGSPLTGPAGLSVNFIDTTVGNPTFWDWDFGDGSPHSTAQNPTHVYSRAGIYGVSLTSSNGSSFNTHTKLGYITVSLVTNFTGSPLTGPAGLSVNFTDTTIGNPTSWNWDFGDGSLHSTAQNPTHVYSRAGIYGVSLTSSNGSSFNTNTKLGYITVNLVTNFIANRTSGTVGLSVNFTDTTIGEPIFWDWDFGDGSPHSFIKNPNHVYNTLGIFTVTLISSLDPI
jgi:PKD repeat protein